MTDITINIKTGSENSQPKVTTTTAANITADPKTESSKEETPIEETPKEQNTDVTIKEETPEKDEPKKMDMTEEEHAKMGSEK